MKHRKEISRWDKLLDYLKNFSSSNQRPWSCSQIFACAQILVSVHSLVESLGLWAGTRVWACRFYCRLKALTVTEIWNIYMFHDIILIININKLYPTSLKSMGIVPLTSAVSGSGLTCLYIYIHNIYIIEIDRYSCLARFTCLFWLACSAPET